MTAIPIKYVNIESGDIKNGYVELTSRRGSDQKRLFVGRELTKDGSLARNRAYFDLQPLPYWDKDRWTPGTKTEAYNISFGDIARYDPVVEVEVETLRRQRRVILQQIQTLKSEATELFKAMQQCYAYQAGEKPEREA